MSRALSVLLMCLLPAMAVAQKTPVVFVHGLNSSGATWQQAADHFANQLAITPLMPDVSWWRPYGEQSATLDGAYRALPSAMVVVGHSNGGVVARQWSRSRPVAGIVTVGSPHRGATVLDNLPMYLDYVYRTMRSVWSAGVALTTMESRAMSGAWSWLAYQLAVYTDYTGMIVDSTVSGLAAAGLFMAESSAPVLRDMKPGSSFLQDLNAGGNLSREASDVPVRVGIVSSAPTYGGVFRAISPDRAQGFGDLEFVLGLSFLSMAIDVQMNADPGDPKAIDTAMTMFEAGIYLFNLDFYWCSAVSMPNGRVGCRANDGVVSVEHQIYPGAVNFFTPLEQGPEHNTQTDRVNPWLEEAFVNYLRLPPAGSGSPGPTPIEPTPPSPPSSGPAMTQNAGIRGCDNYSDWGATYQPSPDACSAYCESNGADACEWDASTGGCWVEFGDGCYVQGGFGGWWAATMNTPEGTRRGGVQTMVAATSVVQALFVLGFAFRNRVREREARRRLMRWLASGQPA